MDLFSNEEVLHPAESRPTPLDIVAFLSYACYQLEAPYSVKINVETQGEYQRVDEKLKKRRHPHHMPRSFATPSDTQKQESEIIAPEPFDSSEEIILTAVMNSAGHLVELAFNRAIQIPRTFIKVIGLCIPFHRHLNRLTVRWGPLTNAGLYEFSKFLFVSQITEICFDDSPVAGRNYEVLLERPSNLRYLSLSRCKLDDVDCLKLASFLIYPRPASKTLNILILVSNMIGDKGACALGQVLRSNRSLQCLNLAGNRITDYGAISIFRSLMEFCLTSDELFGKRSRYMEYLRLRREVYARCIKEMNTEKSQDEVRLSKRRTINRVQRKLSRKISIASPAKLKADAMALEHIGLFSDPFSCDQTMIRAGQTYCVGNTVLCWLNLSFNHLEFASLTSLYEVLMHQSWLGTRVTTGLLRVVIEGNNLPIDCDELFLIEDLLERAHTSKAKIVSKRSSEKSRGRQSKLTY